MEPGNIEISLSVTFHRGAPWIESRARMVGGGDGPLAGKILVTRTPILPPGASKEEIEAATERELLDAEDEVFCPLCAGGEHGAAGRNDPCPCGSGRKYKKCCL